MGLHPQSCEATPHHALRTTHPISLTLYKKICGKSENSLFALEFHKKWAILIGIAANMVSPSVKRLFSDRQFSPLLCIYSFTVLFYAFGGCGYIGFSAMYPGVV
jgi:hypothetical protein